MTEATAGKHGGPDPDVVIPAAVRRSAARAQELVERQNAARTAPVDGEGSVAPAPVDGAPTPPQPVLEGDGATASPSPTSTPSTPPTDNGEDGWKHKFESLQGRFRRAETANQQMSQTISDLQRLMAQMQASAEVQPVQPQQIKRFVTEQEEAEYGREMLDVIGRRAQEIVERTNAPLLAEIDQLKRQLGGVTQVIEVDGSRNVWDSLDRQMPDWRNVNTDPEFISWLALPDPYSGVIRKELIGRAFVQRDVGRIIRFFNGFLAEKAAPGQQSSGVEAPGSGAPPPQVDLTTLAGPGRARSGAGSPPPDKPSFSRADIKKFYGDVNRGAYAGRDTEKIALERQIFEASREGRIRG